MPLLRGYGFGLGGPYQPKTVFRGTLSSKLSVTNTLTAQEEELGALRGIAQHTLKPTIQSGLSHFYHLSLLVPVF